MALLEVNNLNVRFPTEDGVVHAVRDVSFSVDRGEVLGIVGESGSGKSVTNLAIMGLLARSTRIDGSIMYDGSELVGLPRSQQTKFRGNEIGMIFQDPMTSLNPVYTVGWQIAEAYRAHNKVSKQQGIARAVELLDLVGIPQAVKRVHSYPHEFSGGMRQRVMIAMSMANNPQVLIADEPTTALDVTVQAQILETLMEIKERTNIAIVLITHDLGVVAGMADRVMVMYAGAAVEIAPVDEIYYRPKMPYTIGLLGAIPSEASDGKKLRQIRGTTPSLINMKPGCPFSPRCPLVQDRCLTQTPTLEAVDNPAHLAACHRRAEIESIDVRALFAPEVVA
ncbi:MAG: ABC transporter ATP-binding protein [Actinomycetota bacterium]|nr:ABC transporter ATP-binding protein [Actinomycetota bacterium]